MRETLDNAVGRDQRHARLDQATLDLSAICQRLAHLPLRIGRNIGTPLAPFGTVGKEKGPMADTVTA